MSKAWFGQKIGRKVNIEAHGLEAHGHAQVNHVASHECTWFGSAWPRTSEPRGLARVNHVMLWFEPMNGQPGVTSFQT
jgi:hypothetical protein